MNEIRQLPMTITQIAAMAKLPRHRVQYAVESRQIEPAGRIGAALVFDEAGVRHILSTLRRIERPDAQTIHITRGDR